MFGQYGRQLSLVVNRNISSKRIPFEFLNQQTISKFSSIFAFSFYYILLYNQMIWFLVNLWNKSFNIHFHLPRARTLPFRIMKTKTNNVGYTFPFI